MRETKMEKKMKKTRLERMMCEVSEVLGNAVPSLRPGSGPVL